MKTIIVAFMVVGLLTGKAYAGWVLIEQVTTCKSVQDPFSCAQVRQGRGAFEKYVYCDAARTEAFGAEIKTWQGIGNLKVTSSLPINSTWIKTEHPGELMIIEFICRDYSIVTGFWYGS